MQMIYYIGDISKADAEVLAVLAGRSCSILEFGVGASTQILAYYGTDQLTCVETDAVWINKTQTNLKLLGIDKLVKFQGYEAQIKGTYDLIFDDGVDNLRMDFAKKTWPLLRIGGYFVFHDTRRQSDINNVCEFVRLFSPGIELMWTNKDHSNLTVIKKKKEEFYQDWNGEEGKEDWERGVGDVPIDKLRAKIASLHG